MRETTYKPLSPALRKLNSAIQELCQRAYISRAPSLILYIACGFIWLLTRIISVRIYPGPYPNYEQMFLDHRAAITQSNITPEYALPFSPYVGRFNPISPAFTFTIKKPGELVTADVVAPVTFAGPPNIVHGGMVAGIFDDLLGAVNWSGENSGFTGTLTVRYHRHTPILKPIKMKAELVKREGRKTFVRGEMLFEGELTASAEAIFVRPKTQPTQSAS